MQWICQEHSLEIRLSSKYINWLHILTTANTEQILLNFVNVVIYIINIYLIRVNHSNNVINKGIKKESQEMAEALKGLKEAEMLINRKYSEVPVSTTNDQLKIVGSSTNPEVKDESKLIPDMAKELDKPRRSRSRSRSRSRERSRRMRSRSRSRSRSDYYRYAHRRDRDRDRDRDRERERERDRERERRHKERYERELEREHEMMRERERERGIL